jgi:hypothetical protein
MLSAVTNGTHRRTSPSLALQFGRVWLDRRVDAAASASLSHGWQILERWTRRLSEDEQKKILGQTAQMLYRIDLGAMMAGANA